MDEAEFRSRVSALGPLQPKHIERLGPLAAHFKFELVPEPERARVTDEAFVASGRLGPSKTHARIVESRKLGVSKVFVQDHLKTNMVLQVTAHQDKGITKPTRTSGVMEVCSADLFFMPPSNGYIGALLMQDHFSNYLWVSAIKNKSALTISKAFTKLFEVGFIPKLLRLDSGREFLGETLPVFATYKIQIVFSTSNSRGQGGSERMNGVVKSLLARSRVATDSAKWDEALGPIVLALNTTPVEARAGMTPHEIMFRRVSTLTAQLDGPAPVPQVRGGVIEEEEWVTEFDPDHASAKEVEKAVAASVNKAADAMLTRSRKQLQVVTVGMKVRVRLAALDPKVRRDQKDRFFKSSLGEYWTKLTHEVKTAGKMYTVAGFRGSFARQDIMIAE